MCDLTCKNGECTYSIAHLVTVDPGSLDSIVVICAECYKPNMLETQGSHAVLRSLTTEERGDLWKNPIYRHLAMHLARASN